MNHHFANQELARLRHAEALRNATRHARIVDVEVVSKPRPQLLSRVRVGIGNLFAQAPVPRVSSG